MQFVLYYRGILKSNGSAKHKQAIRAKIHPQIEQLWNRSYLQKLRANLVATAKIGNTEFFPLVRKDLDLVADVEITMLRPEPPGNIITQGGDIDNRIKTLLDSLRMPQSEVEAGGVASEGPTPFYCVLEDDNLVTSLSVKTEQWLGTNASDSEVVLLIRIQISQLRSLWNVEKEISNASTWQEYKED